jgi:hypothetical protein
VAGGSGEERDRSSREEALCWRRRVSGEGKWFWRDGGCRRVGPGVEDV